MPSTQSKVSAKWVSAQVQFTEWKQITWMEIGVGANWEPWCRQIAASFFCSLLWLLSGRGTERIVKSFPYFFSYLVILHGSLHFVIFAGLALLINEEPWTFNHYISFIRIIRQLLSRFWLLLLTPPPFYGSNYVLTTASFFFSNFDMLVSVTFQLHWCRWFFGLFGRMLES